MSFNNALRITLSVVIMFWIIKLSEDHYQLDLTHLGIFPRKIIGIKGIFFSPFLHGNYGHLISNTAPFLVLGTSILVFYPKVALQVWLQIYIGSGLLVWAFARGQSNFGANLVHIGASGVIYGFAAFLFGSGIFRRDTQSIAVAAIVSLLYGSLIYGIFPIKTGVSWESHLFGALVGAWCAFLYQKVDLPTQKILTESQDFEGYRNLEGKYFRYVLKEK